MTKNGRLMQFPLNRNVVMQHVSLCGSKITPPPSSGIIARARLKAQLNKTVAGGQRLTLVSAPAGSGKTSLLADWVTYLTKPVSWFSCDDSDNDVVRFFTYLSASIALHSQGVKQLRDAILALPSLPPTHDIGRLLAEAAADAEQLIIVIDDYHHIANPEIHDMVSSIINTLSAQAHIIISSRLDVPLRYVQLWSRGLVGSISAAELAFSIDEITLLLAENEATKTYDPQVIYEQTAGWATGVALSVRALLLGQSQHNVQRLTSAFLADEIWRGLKEETRRFLLNTSVLNTIRPDICNTLLGRTDSSLQLDALWQQNLFITKYDENTYRYYPIFRDFLQQQLQPQQQAELHQKTLDAMMKLSLWDEAGYHATSAQDEELLAKFVLAAAVPLLRQAKLHTLLVWLDQLPKTIVSKHPELALWFAWTLFLTGRVAEAHYWMNEIKNSPPDNVAGALGALQVIAYSMAGTPESLVVAQAAVEACKDSDPIFKATALLSLGQSYASLGDSQMAVQTFREAHVVAHMGSILFAGVVSLANLVFHLYLLGLREEAVRECEWALREYVGEEGKPYLLTGFISMMLGILLYAANDITGALNHLPAGVELSKKLHLLHMIGPGEWYYALALNAAGKSDEAKAVVQDLKETALRHKKEGLLRYAKALEVELALQNGDVQVARAWAEEVAPKLSPGQISLPVEHLAYAKVMYATGNTIESMAVVESLETSARQHKRHTDLIQLLLLKARIEERHAPEYVHEALSIAAPHSLLRAFVEACPDLSRYISRYTNEYPTFVGKVMESTPQEQNKASLFDLSERELELLALVAEGLSNQQIADRLFISLGTTKWHLNNIFSKLGVSRRSEAVARMRELGL